MVENVKVKTQPLLDLTPPPSIWPVASITTLKLHVMAYMIYMLVVNMVKLDYVVLSTRMRTDTYRQNYYGHPPPWRADK